MHCILPQNSSQEFWQAFKVSIEKASDIADKIVKVGDLDVDLLNVSNKHTLIDIMIQFGLHNVIDEPTRFGARNTLLDPIFVNDGCSVIESSVIDIDRSLSDRCTIEIPSLDTGCSKRKV